MEEQIIANANYPNIGGEKGQRYWLGKGINNGI